MSMKPAWPSLSLSRWSKRLLKTLSLFVASVCLVTGLIVPVQSAVQPIVPTPYAGVGVETFLAQDPNTSGNATLRFETPTFTVSVHPRTNNLQMNVYNRDTRQSEQLNAPTTFRGAIANDGWVSYDSFGSRNGRNVIYRASGNRSANQARLEIIDAGSNSVLISQNSTSITDMFVPDGNTGGGASNDLANTIVAFETQNYAVRVFNANNVRKMNVFSKSSQQQVVNGQPATPEIPGMAPYECWVSYFGGQGFGGSSARYFVRVAGNGNALLEVIDGNGSVLLSEPRIASSPLITNIPATDRPQCFGSDGTVANNAALAPYIAAVFGGQNEVQQLQQLLNSTAGNRGGVGLSCVVNPRLESARQGEFINAGECNDYNDAAALVNFLRARGFNSRLVYRNFRYR